MTVFDYLNLYPDKVLTFYYNERHSDFGVYVDKSKEKVTGELRYIDTAPIYHALEKYANLEIKLYIDEFSPNLNTYTIKVTLLNPYGLNINSERRFHLPLPSDGPDAGMYNAQIIDEFLIEAIEVFKNKILGRRTCKF